MAHKAVSKNSVEILPSDPTTGPRTVQDAKLVNLALVSYTDENNRQLCCLAVIGENTVHMLDGKSMGFSQVTTPQGRASDWLRDGVFSSLEKK